MITRRLFGLASLSALLVACSKRDPVKAPIDGLMKDARLGVDLATPRPMSIISVLLPDGSLYALTSDEVSRFAAGKTVRLSLSAEDWHAAMRAPAVRAKA